MSIFYSRKKTRKEDKNFIRRRDYIKFVEEKGKKRATFLDEVFKKNCTLIAHPTNKKQRHA